MRRVRITIIVIFMAAALLLFCGCAPARPDVQVPEVERGTGESVAEPSAEKAAYSLEEVANHASAPDCWMAIEGRVYDLTGYISRHPGGRSMLKDCGKEATESFNTKGGIGRPHSERAAQALADYEIGTLK